MQKDLSCENGAWIRCAQWVYMFGRHAKSVKPVHILDVGTISALGALTVLFPLSALEDSPGNRSYAAALLILAQVGALPLLYVLRRIDRRLQRICSLLSGFFVGLLPFLFYGAVELLIAVSAPLASLGFRGLASGFVLGLAAAWYVPRSTWVRAQDLQDLS